MLKTNLQVQGSSDLRTNYGSPRGSDTGPTMLNVENRTVKPSNIGSIFNKMIEAIQKAPEEPDHSGVLEPSGVERVNRKRSVLQDGGLGIILKSIQERECLNRIEEKKKKFKNKLKQRHIADGTQGGNSMNGNYVHSIPGSNREYFANKCLDKCRSKINIAWYNKCKKNNLSGTNARSSQDLMWPMETPAQRAQKKYKHLQIEGLLINHGLMSPSIRDGSPTNSRGTEPHNSDEVHTRSLVLPTIVKAQNPFGPGYFRQPFKHQLPEGFSSMQRQPLSPPHEDADGNFKNHISKMLRDSADAEPSIQKYK